jgi:hypothetical protein
MKKMVTPLLQKPLQLKMPVDIQQYLKGNYQKRVKEMNAGMAFFKDEINGAIDKTGACINLLTLPINNFLKDFAQMDLEFEHERTINASYCICLDGTMLTEADVLSMPMEQNY